MIRASEVVFILTREDVIGCAKEMGIPEKMIDDDFLRQVKDALHWGLDCWPEAMKAAIQTVCEGWK